MNYETLVSKTAKRSDISQSDVSSVLAALRSVIVDALKEKENVKFVRLGTFKVIDYKPTRRRDPNTREIRSIPARVKPKFVFSELVEEELSKE